MRIAVSCSIRSLHCTNSAFHWSRAVSFCRNASHISSSEELFDMIQMKNNLSISYTAKGYDVTIPTSLFMRNTSSATVFANAFSSGLLLCNNANAVSRMVICRTCLHGMRQLCEWNFKTGKPVCSKEKYQTSGWVLLPSSVANVVYTDKTSLQSR